jgi:Flp pilus assembly protein TadG
MKSRRNPISPVPHGKVLVLTAFLMTAFMGLAALVVDIGVITMARAQLKTVADAAALAGARQLASDRRLSATITDLTPEISAANAQAIAIGQNNSVLNQSAVVAASDVVVGYLDPTNPSDTLHTGSSYTLQFNSVQVTATRSSDHGGVVPAFFSALLGYGGSAISVTSTATVNLYGIQGYSAATNGLNASILPIAMISTNYNNMMNGTTGDDYTFNPANFNPPTSNGVTGSDTNPQPDGVHESVAYPVGSGSGNWGTINFTGQGGNGTSTLVGEIDNGVPPSEIASPPAWYYANPGISAGIKGSLTSIIGYPVAVAIYDTDNGGNGANLQYHITAYATVRIVAVNFQGNPKYVIVQPAVGNDPTAIPNTGTVNSWTQGGQIVLHLSR